VADIRRVAAAEARTRRKGVDQASRPAARSDREAVRSPVGATGVIAHRTILSIGPVFLKPGISQTRRRPTIGRA